MKRYSAPGLTPRDPLGLARGLQNGAASIETWLADALRLRRPTPAKGFPTAPLGKRRDKALCFHRPRGQYEPTGSTLSWIGEWGSVTLTAVFIGIVSLFTGDLTVQALAVLGLSVFIVVHGGDGGLKGVSSEPDGRAAARGAATDGGDGPDRPDIARTATAAGDATETAPWAI